MYIYHGSFVSNITTLKPNLKMHNGKEEKIVYLTSNYAYALFYIWDPVNNHRKNKYITAYIKDGIVYYEEQFPNQFYEFYHKVNGCVYYVLESDAFIKGSEESFYISNDDTKVVKCDFIDNVHNKILEYINKGLVKILYYNEQPKEKQESLKEKIVHVILKKQIIGSDNEEELFFKKYFVEAYNRAVQSIEKRIK